MAPRAAPGWHVSCPPPRPKLAPSCWPSPSRAPLEAQPATVHGRGALVPALSPLVSRTLSEDTGKAGVPEGPGWAGCRRTPPADPHGLGPGQRPPLHHPPSNPQGRVIKEHADNVQQAGEQLQREVEQPDPQACGGGVVRAPAPLESRGDSHCRQLPCPPGPWDPLGWAAPGTEGLLCVAGGCYCPALQMGVQTAPRATHSSDGRMGVSGAQGRVRPWGYRHHPVCQEESEVAKLLLGKQVEGTYRGRVGLHRGEQGNLQGAGRRAPSPAPCPAGGRVPTVSRAQC